MIDISFHLTSIPEETTVSSSSSWRGDTHWVDLKRGDTEVTFFVPSREVAEQLRDAFVAAGIPLKVEDPPAPQHPVAVGPDAVPL